LTFDDPAARDGGVGNLGSCLDPRRIKLLVVGGNTVSAMALEDLRKEFDRLPILGVVEPAAEAAVR
jgi:glutamate racemase